MSGEAISGEDYTVNFDSEGEETTILNTGQTTYGKMTATPNGKLVFYQQGQIKIYDPTTEELQEATFNDRMSWNSKVFGNSTMLGHYQANLWKYDFSDINNISEELVFNGGNRNIENYFEDGDAIYFSIYNNGSRTLFKKVDGELTVLYDGNDEVLDGLYVYNGRILLIRSNRIYELINPGPDSYFVYTNQIRDNNGSNVYISSDKVFTYNNEIYALAGNLPGKLTIPSEIQDNNTYTPIFTTISSIDPTGTIQDAGFDSVTGNLFTHNISYDDQGFSIYSANSYRVAPAIKISAGQTTASFSIDGVTDGLYELTESIIVQPGTPTNASYSDDLVTNYNVNPINLELINNDDISDVTYAFSSPTIQEFPYEDVTLTATLSAVSGVDVTIPFTLSNNASTTVEVSSTEIVISAGQLTGSITVSTTEDLDDDLVEILEPVVFTFGIITNATSDITEIILNLESDDDPTITAIGTTGGLTSQAEGGSFELTASINSVSSKDATIPLTFLGDAIFDEDYTVNFDSKGEETQILDLQTNNYGTMRYFS